MPRPLPDCPRCDGATLEAARADAKGHVWAVCPACRISVIVNADGRIVHTGAKQ